MCIGIGTGSVTGSSLAKTKTDENSAHFLLSIRGDFAHLAWGIDGQLRLLLFVGIWLHSSTSYDVR